MSSREEDSEEERDSAHNEKRRHPKELKFVKNENFKEKTPRQSKKSGRTDQEFLDMHSELVKEVLYRGNDTRIILQFQNV